MNNRIVFYTRQLKRRRRIKLQLDKKFAPATRKIPGLGERIVGPICDQAGECRLQEYATEHGRGTSRFVEVKNIAEKAVDIGPHVMLDQERCIQCSRCIRFSPIMSSVISRTTRF